MAFGNRQYTRINNSREYRSAIKKWTIKITWQQDKDKHYAQTTTDNVNKTQSLLHTTTDNVSKAQSLLHTTTNNVNKPSIVFHTEIVSDIKTRNSERKDI